MVVFLSDPHDEFVDLVVEINKMKGMKSLQSKLVGELFIEPGDLSLEELAERTGYSISAVSGAMKSLTDMKLVERKKKPGSRKVFFHMEKSLVENFARSFEKAHRKEIREMEDRIPGIMASYDEQDSERSEKEREIVEKYYSEVKQIGEIVDEVLERCRKLKGGGRD